MGLLAMAPFNGFDVAAMPDLAEKVILITGGTGGIGKTTILELARHNPGHIYFTGRNTSAAEAVIKACAPSLPSSRLTFLQCDHTSLESIRANADKFAHDRLDIFIANAGIHTNETTTTADGIEIQFGTNHVGSTALLLRLLPVMLRTAAPPLSADVRFISLTSLAYNTAPREGIRFGTLRSPQADMPYGAWGRYGQSKLANVLFARTLAARYPQLTSVAVHPGIVDTPMVRGLGLVSRWVLWLESFGYLTEEQGAYNTLWAATAPDVKERLAGGRVALFSPVGRATSGTAKCWDDELAEQLWTWTEEVVGVKAPDA